MTLRILAQHRQLAVGKDTIQIHPLPRRAGPLQLTTKLLQGHLLHWLLHGRDGNRSGVDGNCSRHCRGQALHVPRRLEDVQGDAIFTCRFKFDLTWDPSDGAGGFFFDQEWLEDFHAETTVDGKSSHDWWDWPADDDLEPDVDD